MAAMARNGINWLVIIYMAVNGLTQLKMAVNGYKRMEWMEIAGNNLILLEFFLKKKEKGWTWLEIANKMAGNYWILQETTTSCWNGWKWLELSGNVGKWLEMAEIAGKGWMWVKWL